MATVDRNGGGWDVNLTPGETMTLSTANTYVDGNIRIAAPKILQSKQYLNFLASGNSDPAGYYYFGQIKPSSTYNQWRIKFRIHMEVPYNTSVVNSQYMSYEGSCELYGYNDQITAYKNFNSHNNTNYRTFYQYEVFRAKTAALSTYGHLPGFRFYSSYNPATANYNRNITIDLLEIENCTFEFFDDLKLYSDCPGTGSTNYVGRSEYDGANNGLRETGDDNDTSSLHENYHRLSAGRQLGRYQIFMQDKDGKLQPLVTTVNSTATTKPANTIGFQLNNNMWWTNTSTEIAQNTVAGALYQQVLQWNSYCNYTFNQTTYTANSIIYLKGYIHEDGLFYLDNSGESLATKNYTSWYKVVPHNVTNLSDYFVNDGSVYVEAIHIYTSTNGNPWMLPIKHPAYIYDGTNLVEYHADAVRTKRLIVDKKVELDFNVTQNCLEFNFI